jgi:MoaA/NifB/PqqE/SkfB family radical SAM enzyme
MIGQPASLKTLLEYLRNPATDEKQAILYQRWEALDPALRLPGQGLGQKATGCGATIGIQPRCDFACTGCYLGTEANHVPALPTAAILRQLDTLRAWLGPKSNVQITDGEVTLRPVEELTEILRYARSIGIVPMVMTHGDSFRRRPGLLEQLMEEGGLTEVSIHVDITQRGRQGYGVPKSEGELMDLRGELADIVRAARKTTGRKLRAATTLTISRQNLEQVADVVRWLIANRDAFSLVSFQPLAQVGRTRRGLEGVTADELWEEIGRATADFGLELPDRGAEPLHFGHPACTRFVPVLAVERPRETPRLFQFIRNQPEDVALMQEFFTRRLGGVAFRDDLPIEALARAAGLLRAAPGWFLGPVRRWADNRLQGEAGTSLARLFADALRGRVRVDGLTLTSHHFMSPAELRTEEGRQRLDACVFRLPYKGDMVPMCKMNADGVRDQLYADIIEGKTEGATEGTN